MFAFFVPYRAVVGYLAPRSSGLRMVIAGRPAHEGLSMSSPAHVEREAARRRTFAIISHPDAGKTTLTEKFLLYSGAITEAGIVRSRRETRDTASDWTELERKRGISVTSAVLRFGHDDRVMNLLDTPGHRDFSEDTYRVLSAVDSAIMVLDAAKGVEPQTRKLFEVCRRRGTPLVTFVNKLDRPHPEPLAILDDIEQQIGLVATPVTWPVRDAGRFEGVVDRRDRTYYDFETTAHGTTIAPEQAREWAPSDHRSGSTTDEELDLLDALGLDLDEKRFLAGETTPTFFGSALNNFGVRLLLDALVDLAPGPQPRQDVGGEPRHIDDPFSGFVFKVQANMDPNHRDRVAFVRVCSGRFERGMTATCTRTGNPFAMRYAHEVFGGDRDTLDEAFPGDVFGVVNATDLRIGDTLYAQDEVAFPPPPTFAPEHFRVATPTDRSRVKQFRRGLVELDEEGVVQVLRHRERGDMAPVLAAVGPLQFDVAAWRFDREFGSPIRYETAPYDVARRTDADGERFLRTRREADVYERTDGARLALFRSRYQLERFERDYPDLTLDSIIEV